MNIDGFYHQVRLRIAAHVENLPPETPAAPAPAGPGRTIAAG